MTQEQKNRADEIESVIFNLESAIDSLKKRKSLTFTAFSWNSLFDVSLSPDDILPIQSYLELLLKKYELEFEKL